MGESTADSAISLSKGAAAFTCPPCVMFASWRCRTPAFVRSRFGAPGCDAPSVNGQRSIVVASSLMTSPMLPVARLFPAPRCALLALGRRFLFAPRLCGSGLSANCAIKRPGAERALPRQARARWRASCSMKTANAFTWPGPPRASGAIDTISRAAWSRAPQTRCGTAGGCRVQKSSEPWL